MAAETAREAPARFDLAVVDIPAAVAARSFWSRLPGWLSSDLRLRDGDAEEIRDKDRQHLDLVRRHGLDRVLAFYDEELLPAAARLPAGVEQWRLWFRLGCRTVALQAAAAADGELVEHAERLAAALPRARFDDDPQADQAVRQQVRPLLAGHLADAAERLRRAGRDAEALRAYVALDRLGATGPDHRAAHARLLWRLDGRDADALRVYLRAPAPAPPEIERFIAESLAVDEASPRHELAERLFLNQLALCSPRPPSPAWRNAGLAYLRTGQPARALPYLERALALDAALAAPGGGAAAFYLGQARFQMEDYTGSAAAFEEATARGYGRVRIAAWLGLAHARLGRWEQALAIFRQAEAEAEIESDAGEVPAGELYLHWGRASFVVGELQDALLRFDTAAAADAADPRPRFGIALCRERLGETGRALGELREVAGRWPEFAPAIHRLGQALETAGDLAGAIGHFQRAVELSPGDPEYHLSLGLALEQAEDPAALFHLEAAAEAGAGGPEVLRRLVLLGLQQDHRPRARRWLAALAAAEPGSPDIAGLRARDLASQATEAFNAGRHRDAVELWERSAGGRAGDPDLEARLALALAHDAAARLRAGDLAAAAPAIERAHRLAPGLADCRYLRAVFLLLDGGPAAAGEVARLLRGLVLEQPARPELLPLAALAAALAGDAEPEGGPPVAAAPAGGPPRALLGLLQVLAAAADERFEEAAQRCEEWLADPGAASGLGLPRDVVGALVAAVKLRGARRRRQQVVRFLEGLEARDGAAAWAAGLAAAKQILATEKGLARAGEAEPAELQACRAAWRALPATALTGRFSARLLIFLACHHAQRGRLAAALAALEELAGLEGSVPAEVGDLERVLRLRLARPSHEKACMLLEEDPEAARQTWETLLAADPGDLAARHHLACLAWSRAYDAVLARRVEDSLPFWQEGLEHFRQLYGGESYWQGLREKGRALGTAAHPFDEAAFETWRREALYQRAATLLDLVFHLLTGADLGEAKKADVTYAKGLLALLQSSGLDAALRQRLADDFAGRYLDPDPTRVTDGERSRRRALAVLEIDPANVKARIFLVRNVTHEVGTRSQEGERDFAGMAVQLFAVADHAQWLAERLPAKRRQPPAEQQERTKGDLAAYYDQLGFVRHQEGQDATEKLNALGSGRPHEARRLVETVSQVYRDSDRWFEKSLALDPVNPRARGIIERHRSEYPTIDRLLRELR